MNIALISNPEKDIGYAVSSDLVKFFINRGSDVYTEKPIGSAIVAEKDEAVKLSDVVVTVGGDGTILKVVKEAYKYDKPIAAVNLGTVGYMSSLEPYEYCKLEALLCGNCDFLYRSVLSVSAGNCDRTVCSDVPALNDAVISHGNWTHIMNLKLFCNGKSVTEYRADGLIFATPTGSTAYSLSAGGPIIDTELGAIEVTPICSHSFNGRSILFKDSSFLEATSASGRGNIGYLTIDGLDNYKLEANDVVKVCLAEKKIRTVKFDDDSFFNVLSKKIK